MNQYDVIIIGAGSSGLMAAINSAQAGAKTLLIEKNKKAGRKLLLSGGGRCNVTNRTQRDNLIAHIPGNGKFLYSALNQFDQDDIVSFFEEAGVALKEEDHGRMFPVTNRARTILDTLLDIAQEAGVELRLNTPVQALLYGDQGVMGLKTIQGDHIQAKSIVIATGGKAYPGTGSTGDGYQWAKTAGHTIERLYPTEAPLLSKDSLISDGTLRGISLRDVTVTVWQGPIKTSKAIVQHQMDMIFTHFGYSGPAILRSSGHVNQHLYETGAKFCWLSIDLVPDLTVEDLTKQAEESRDRQILNILKQWMPERIAEYLTSQCQIDSSTPYKQLIHEQINHLWNNLKFFPMTAYGSLPIEKGFVTGGGVNTKEIDPKTMASKLMPGLYFCGEVIDINGYTGGYNITSAFVTGTVAGRYAAWDSFAK